VEVRKEGDAGWKSVQAPALNAPQDDELNYLRAVARNGLVVDGPGSLSINVVVAEVLDAARESAKTGRTVKIMKRVNLHTSR